MPAGVGVLSRRVEGALRPVLSQRIAIWAREATGKDFRAAGTHQRNKQQIVVSRWSIQEPWGDDVRASCRDERNEFSAVLDRDEGAQLHAS
jgi:hypothetical protein